MYRAQACLQAGQWDAAAADYKEALRAFPAAYEPYQGLANVALRRETPIPPTSTTGRASPTPSTLPTRQLRTAPDNIPALVNRGNLLSLMGDFSNAIPPLTRALSLTNSLEVRATRAWSISKPAGSTRRKPITRRYSATFPLLTAPIMRSVASRTKGRHQCRRHLLPAVPGQHHERNRRDGHGYCPAEVHEPPLALTSGGQALKA